ncbi:hypothetical protein SNEBB_010218 [Seison nebaliae]|nr:hypothetical protein SNEBB_010218 [Seison nebaliae]
MPRWKSLNTNQFYKKREVEGFYNNNDLGVCTMNVMLSFLMSSTYLYKKIKEIRPVYPFYPELQKAKKSILGLVGAVSPARVEPKDVLRKGICDAWANIPYYSPHGVAGDFNALQAFTQIGGFINAKFPKATRYFGLYHTPVTQRFHLFLDALFNNLKPEDYTSKDYSFDYSFYNELNLLNIEFSTKNVNYDALGSVPFDENYYNEIGPRSIGRLDNKLRNERIEPNVILMWFSSKPNLRIHQHSITNLKEHIQDAIKYNIVDPDPYVKLTFTKQIFTTPIIGSELYTYPFPIRGRDIRYQLKAISFRLEEETQRFLHQFDAVRHPQAKIETCVRRLKEKTSKLLKGYHEKLVLYRFFRDYFDHFAGVCRDTMYVDNSEIYKAYDQVRHGFHTFAIISREDKWYMMNDQHAYEIDDITSLTYLLSDEKVDAILLEKYEPSRRKRRVNRSPSVSRRKHYRY